MESELRLLPVRDEERTERVSLLAGQIWREYLAPLLGGEQVEYMLQAFQSSPALTRLIEQEDFRYFLLREKEQDIGYFAFRVEGDVFFLSKLYLLRDHRGRGLGGRIVRICKRLCHLLGLSQIRLFANASNPAAVATYQKLGFRMVRREKADIGGGYSLDHFVMALPAPVPIRARQTA